eukprot:1762887-Lingulodinium_polyedra.AAC.1
MGRIRGPQRSAGCPITFTGPTGGRPLRDPCEEDAEVRDVAHGLAEELRPFDLVLGAEVRFLEATQGLLL